MMMKMWPVVGCGDAKVAGAAKCDDENDFCLVTRSHDLLLLNILPCRFT